MQNKRFRLCEQAIFVAYYKIRDLPNAKKLAKRAKISRQAFYMHHKSPQWIPYDYEKYLLDSYSAKMKTFMVRKQIELRMLYLRLLIFVHTHKEMIGALIKDGRTEVIDEMVVKLKKRILLEWNLAGNLEEVFQVYKKEVAGVIEVWAKDGFAKKELDKVLKEIMFLTKTSPQRLAPLIKAEMEDQE